MSDFETASRREPNRRSRELQQPRYVEARAGKQYSVDEDGDEWTFVTGRQSRARLPENKTGYSRVDYEHRTRSAAYLPWNLRDVIDILSRSESDYDDRRRQAVSAGRRCSARKSRRESPQCFE